MIASEDTAKFEKAFGRQFNLDTCCQAVRHHGLFVGLGALDREEIRYDIIIAGQGDVVVTKPRQHHAVVNYTDCLAVAINHLHPGEPAFPDTPRELCVFCGLYNFEHPQLLRTSGCDSRQD